jgi:hypothetical protein
MKNKSSSEVIIALDKLLNETNVKSLVSDEDSAYLSNDVLSHLKNKTNFSMSHWSNGTLKTVEHLTGINKYDLLYGIYDYNIHIKKKMSNYFKLMKRAVDYYAIGNYIFVHG